MIALLDRKRGRQFTLLLIVAVAQLGATLAVAQGLHRLDRAQDLTPLVAIALAAFVLELLQRRIGEGIGLGYAAQLRAELFRHLLSVDPQVIRARRHGAMLQSFVGDLTALRQWVSEGLIRAILAVLALVGLLGWLAFEAPDATGPVAAVVAVMLALGGALVLPLHRAVRQVRRARGRVSALASDRLGASATVLACGRARSEALRLERRVEQLNSASLHRAWISATLRALPHLAVTAMLIALVLASPGSTPGGFAALVLVIGLIGHALRDLFRAAELAVPGRVSRWRLATLLAIAPLPLAAATARRKGERNLLVLDGVRLAPGAARLSTGFAAGERILVDGDPAMRRTLFAAMAGITALPAGEIRWSGTNLGALPPAKRRKLVGWASAELPPVGGSTMLNLRYRAPHVSEAALAELAQRWGIEPAAQNMPPARVALLRAMMGNPPVLLLDPVEQALGADDIERLRQAALAWPGVVLLCVSHPQLRALGTARIVLDKRGSGAGGGDGLALARVVRAGGGRA